MMNVAISVLYSEGFWIPSHRAAQIAKMIYAFLACYQTCCAASLKKLVNRFALTPKCHMIAHAADQLEREAAVAAWVTNPLATANQMQEDFIGRPSRLSRRVHQARLHTRVFQRSLLEVFHALHGENGR